MSFSAIARENNATRSVKVPTADFVRGKGRGKKFPLQTGKYVNFRIAKVRLRAKPSANESHRRAFRMLNVTKRPLIASALRSNEWIVHRVHYGITNVTTDESSPGIPLRLIIIDHRDECLTIHRGHEYVAVARGRVLCQYYIRARIRWTSCPSIRVRTYSRLDSIV